VTTLTVTINGRGYGPTEVREELTMNDYLREYPGSPARNSAAAQRNV
jgi:hypothetical protein